MIGRINGKSKIFQVFDDVYIKKYFIKGQIKYLKTNLGFY